MDNFYEHLLQRSNQAKHAIEHTTSTYKATDLNWKERAKKWSVLEVIEHLNQVYSIYLPNFEKTISAADSLRGEQQREQRSLLGRLSVYLMKPKNKKRKFKMKTFDFFEPDLSDHDQKMVVDTFMKNKEHFNKLIKEARKKDLHGIKMATSLEKLKFYVSECFDFVLVHEERHLQQISEILDKLPTTNQT